MSDVVVFADPDGKHYVACFGEDRRWYRWPAERHGWRSRTSCSESLAEQCEELPPTLARLALVLSGVDGC